MSNSEVASIHIRRMDPRGGVVRCCHPECNVPASYAHASISHDGPNVRLYEMQPYCVYHWLRRRGEAPEH